MSVSAVKSSSSRKRPKPEAKSIAQLQRIQLSRVKGWKMPANTRKVDRATIYGNPFAITGHEHEKAVTQFRAWLTGEMTRQEIEARYAPLVARHLIAKRQWILEGVPHLRGKNLACWCQPPKPGEPDLCHAAVLLQLANRDG